MQLSTNQIIDLFKALTELRGTPVIVNEDGRKKVYHEPFPMSEKAKWNAAKNRAILKRLVVAHDEMQQDALATLQAFKKAQKDTVTSEADPAIKAQKQEAAMAVVQARVDELNQEAIKVGRMEQEVENLLLIPANGFFLKTSPIPPTIISELMVLIDGEPEFDDKPSK